MVQWGNRINIQYSEQLKFICRKAAEVARQLGDGNCRIYVEESLEKKTASVTL